MNVEELFEAMRVISQKTIEEAKIDKTIVTSIESEAFSDGGYMVSYFTEKLKCYPQGLVKYKIGDSVRVLVPEGDFSKKKIILGLTSERVEDIESDLESVIVGEGFNYLISPVSWKLSTLTKPISIDQRICSQMNKISVTHLRISSEIFSDFIVQSGMDIGIRLKVKKASGSLVVFELNRKTLQGNLGALNGKLQSVIFDIGEEGFDAVEVTGEYFSTSSDVNHISFTNSKIDLINKDFANTVINGLYEISIQREGGKLKASISNEEFGELDQEGALFSYQWSKATYNPDGTKTLEKIGSSKYQDVIPGVKYYEVAVDATL